MDSASKKKTVIACVVAGLTIAAFLGASAWRYFAVVAPAEQQNETEAESIEAPSGEKKEKVPDSKHTVDGGEGVSYSGPEGDVWSVLGNFTWRTVGGESYLSFGEDGTVRSAAKGSTAAPAKNFEILAVEGELASPAGCIAVIRVDETYATMSVLSAATAEKEAFAAFPEGEYAISCPLFNNGAVFYKDPDGPIEVEYQQELPPILADNKKTIDNALTAAAKTELPAVSKLSWEPYVSFSYDEKGNAYYMSSFACNDAIGTDVMVLFYPADKKVVVETSGAVTSTTSSTDAASAPAAPEQPAAGEADSDAESGEKAGEQPEAKQKGGE